MTIRSGFSGMVVSPNVFFNVTGNPADAVPAELPADLSASLPHAAGVVATSTAVTAAPITRGRDQDMVTLLRKAVA